MTRGLSQRDPLVEIDEDMIRCAKIATDNRYRQPLRPWHWGASREFGRRAPGSSRVRPKEVEQYLSKWIQALKAKLKMLEDIGA